MYMNDLPPGIHDWEVDRQFGDDEKVPDIDWAKRKLLVRSEKARRLQVVTDLKLDINNPYNRLFVNGR